MSSSARFAALLSGAAGDEAPPFVGALLRLCHERVRARLDEAIRAAGFTDLQATHMAVFSFPPPDGVRPSDLARRIRMSRQATNHVIAQLEALGYLERRAIEGSERRLVYMTERAWRLIEPIFACLREVEAEWASEVGPERFRDFKTILRRFATEAPRG